MPPFNPKKAYMTTGIIALNVLYFLFLSTQGNPAYDLELLVRYGAIYTPYVTEQHEYYRLLTACFIHFGIAHLVNNMIVLFAIGDILERTIGHWRFLLVYLLAGIGANAISCYYHLSMQDITVAAGASGAVFGIVGALLFAVIRNRGRLMGMSFRSMLIYVVLSVYLSAAAGGVDNTAHIGGLVLGFLLCAIVYHPKALQWQNR